MGGGQGCLGLGTGAVMSADICPCPFLAGVSRKRRSSSPSSVATTSSLVAGASPGPHPRSRR